MNDYKNFCEYTVRPEGNGGRMTLKILLTAVYTLLTLVCVFLFWFVLRSWALLILYPFVLFALVSLTWRYVNVEYEFAVEAGNFTVAFVYDGRSRRVKFNADLSQMTLLAPRGERSLALTKAPDIAKCSDFSASPDSPDAWVGVLSDGKGGKCAVIFETNEEMRRLLRFFNPAAVRNGSAIR